MSGGVFGVARDIFNHPMFDQQRQFSRLEAWLWMLAEAAWKPHERRIGKQTLRVKRGELCASVRFMAGAWGWKPARVQRFLDALKTDTMIETSAIHGINIISICNYSEYQVAAIPKRTAIETPTDTAAIQQRYKLEEGEEREERNIPLRGRVAAPDLETEVFRVGKSVLGKNSGGVISNLRRKCEFDDAYALELISTASEKQNPMEWMQGVLRNTEKRHLRGVMGAPQPTGPVIESKADREYREWEKRYYRGLI